MSLDGRTATSIGSRRVFPEYSVVGVSKAAIEAVTRYLAVELAPQGIIANCISPGVVLTGAIDFFKRKDEMLAHAGDVTLFSPADSRDADAIDVVATITNLRAACNDTGGHIVSTASYDVIARRTDPAGAREVTFPTFAAVIQAGTKLVAKQTGQVTVRFADGQTRATGSGSSTGSIDREAASLSAEISQKIERKRKPALSVVAHGIGVAGQLRNRHS